MHWGRLLYPKLSMRRINKSVARSVGNRHEGKENRVKFGCFALCFIYGFTETTYKEGYEAQAYAQELTHRPPFFRVGARGTHRSWPNCGRGQAAQRSSEEGRISPRVSAITKGKTQDKVNALTRLVASAAMRFDEILRRSRPSRQVILEEMYEKLGAAGIDVLEGGSMLEDRATIPSRDKKLQHRHSDSNYDSMQMYLREIGQYPLLKASRKRTSPSASSTATTRRAASSHAATCA